MPPHHPRLVHLRARGTSLVLHITSAALPQIVHWGADLGDLDEEALAALVALGAPAIPHSAYDEPQPLELLPQAARGHAGRGVLSGHRPGAPGAPLFTLRDVHAEQGRLVVRAHDNRCSLGLETEVVMDPQGVLRMRHSLRNDGPDDYELASLPVQLAVPARARELLDLSGRWGKERVPQRTVLGHGAWVREGRRGRTGHDAPLLLVAGTEGFGNRAGEVWAVHVGWSGDTQVWAERLPEGRTAIGGGELLATGEIRLAPDASYTTPWLYGVHSTEGLDGLSHLWHDWVRARPNHPRSPRPVVLNTWEAVYFEHDLEKLGTLAQNAAEIGVERFVLDDGWFGGRRSDRAGLGDWTVSRSVWPEGLAPLISRVRSLGMDFGLWVEPEMVNLDSDLARAHPEWLLAVPGRTPPSWRHQHALDLAQPAPFEHILGRLDALLTDHDIAYLKWDHNRDLTDAQHADASQDGTQQDGAPGVHAQTLAYYALLDELRARHPGVEIETCASGGARIDLEVLSRTDRAWTSDCTDAVERQAIQRWTSLLVPPELLGAHVSSPRNHQTGRVLDLSFRAGTALFCHFGIEWDISRATDDELAELAGWISTYKQLRGLLHQGEVVHSDHVEPGSELHGVVSPDGRAAVYALVQLDTLDASLPARLRLPGLDPMLRYRVGLQAPGQAPRTTQVGPPPWCADPADTDPGLVVPGSVLAQVGVAIPILAPQQLLLLRVDAVG